MKCLDCGSTEIRTRKMHSHGKSSKAKVSYVCKACNSSNIEKPQANRRFNRRR